MSGSGSRRRTRISRCDGGARTSTIGPPFDGRPHATTPRPPRPARFGLPRGAARRHRACRRCRSVQDRLHPAHDRPVGIDRQADRGRGQALPGAERLDLRRPQGRADHQGRRRRRRHDAPGRPGADRQRQGRRPRRLRPDAARARDRADRDPEQDADGRHRGGDVDDPLDLALHHPHQLRAAAGDRADGRLGGQERHQESRHLRRRLRPRARRREVLQEPVHSSTAARSSARSARRCAAPTSRRSCRRSPTSSPTRCSCSCRPGRARRS